MRKNPIFIWNGKAISPKRIYRSALRPRRLCETRTLRSQSRQGVELRSWIEKHYSLPKEDLPDYSFCVNGGDGPEAAAEFLRAHWNLGNQPIGNMIQLLELHGIAVFSAREENADLRFDAFSFFTDGQPYVFLSTSKTPERDRFDAAHELGHLVMHNSPVHKETKTRESEANLFASAFLMPAADVKAVCPFNASINAVKNLKIRWGVAATALCTRLFQLDMSLIGFVIP